MSDEHENKFPAAEPSKPISAEPMRKFANIDAPEGDESTHEQLPPGERARQAFDALKSKTPKDT